MGSGCCSVGRAVTSKTRGPWFESSHRKFLLNIYLGTTNCIEKTEKKRSREWHILIKVRRGPLIACTLVSGCNVCDLVLPSTELIFCHNLLVIVYTKYASLSQAKNEWLRSTCFACSRLISRGKLEYLN